MLTTTHSLSSVCARCAAAADFYILQEGECAVSTLNAQTHEPVPVAKVHAGQSFGEVALLYATQRSATVQCLSDGGCTVWSVSGREFLAHCQRGSLFLQHVFFRFAQLQDEVTHERLMTREDFIAAMRFINRHQRPSSSPSSSFSLSFSSAPSSSSTPLSDSRLRLMFRLADVSGDSAISFVEFLHLHILLTHPHSCAELAFRSVTQSPSCLLPELPHHPAHSRSSVRPRVCVPACSIRTAAGASSATSSCGWCAGWQRTEGRSWSWRTTATCNSCSRTDSRCHSSSSRRP